MLQSTGTQPCSALLRSLNHPDQPRHRPSPHFQQGDPERMREGGTPPSSKHHLHSELEAKQKWATQFRALGLKKEALSKSVP